MEILGGPLFAVAGAGESHGPGVTSIVYGCPPGLRLTRQGIQDHLDRRRPGSSKHGTTRREGDRVLLLSGLYALGEEEALLAGPDLVRRDREGGREEGTETYEEGWTTGEPIAALVLSTSRRSGDYAQFAGPRGEVRPGHTDLVKHHKSRGYADPRGGGRSSYRSTISDVVGGSVARLWLAETFGTGVLSSVCQVGPVRARRTLAEHLESLTSSPDEALTPEQIRQVEETLTGHQLHTIDGDFDREAVELIQAVRVEGDSVGAAIEIVAVNVPPLAGEPLYQSLKLRLMGSLGGLHATQSCEIGAGFDVVARRGSENNDPIRRSGYQSNNQGGVIGGVTTGRPLVCRVGLKPTSTIRKPQLSVRKDLEEIDFQVERGRHDPCVGVRAGVTLESRLAIELMNAVLVHQARVVDPEVFRLF